MLHLLIKPGGLRPDSSQWDWTKSEWVLTTRDGRDALSVAGHSDAPIQVLVTDIVMPHVRGPELAKRLKASSPDHPELQVVAPRAPP